MTPVILHGTSVARWPLCCRLRWPLPERAEAPITPSCTGLLPSTPGCPAHLRTQSRSATETSRTIHWEVSQQALFAAKVPGVLGELRVTALRTPFYCLCPAGPVGEGMCPACVHRL
jgi:hypothetical protein